LLQNRTIIFVANSRTDFAARILLVMLGSLTTVVGVGKISNMKTVALIQSRIIYSELAFAELVLWRLAKPVVGSRHKFKYRLAYVVRGVCVLRYDNESGQGDHRHVGETENAYVFTTPDQQVADFQHDIARWNDENRNS